MAGLLDIPGYGGFLQQGQLNDQQAQRRLQGVLGALQVAQGIEGMQAQQAVRGVLAQTGGDPAQAIPALIKMGMTKPAMDLAHMAQYQSAVGKESRMASKENQFRAEWEAMTAEERNGQKGRNLLTQYFPERAMTLNRQINVGVEPMEVRYDNAIKKAEADGNPALANKLRLAMRLRGLPEVGREVVTLTAAGMPEDQAFAHAVGRRGIKFERGPNGEIMVLNVPQLAAGTLPPMSTGFTDYPASGQSSPAPSGVLGATPTQRPATAPQGVLGAQTGNDALSMIRALNAQGVTGVQVAVPPGAPEPTWPVAGQTPAAAPAQAPAPAPASATQPGRLPGTVAVVGGKREMREANIDGQNRTIQMIDGKPYDLSNNPIDPAKVRPVMSSADVEASKREATDARTITNLTAKINELETLAKNNPRLVAGWVSPVGAVGANIMGQFDPKSQGTLNRAEQLRTEIIQSMGGLSRLSNEDRRRIESMFQLGFSGTAGGVLSGVKDIRDTLAAKYAGVGVPKGRTRPGQEANPSGDDDIAKALEIIGGKR